MDKDEELKEEEEHNDQLLFGSSRNDANSKKDPLLVRVISKCMGQPPQQQQHSLVGILLITLGSFCFSCMFLFVKFMQGKANSFTMTFYRALVEVPIALLLCYQAGEHPMGPHNRQVRAWLWVRGGMGGAAVLCFFYAIQRLPLPDAVTLQFTTPPFAAVFAACLAGEPWLWMDRIGAAVCLLGVMLIAHPSWLFGGITTTTTPPDDEQDASDQALSLPPQPPQDMGAIAVALLGAAFAGMAYMSVRKIGHEASANVMVLYYSCLSLPITVAGSKGLLDDWNVWGGGVTFSWTDWCWMLLTGIFAYTGQYLTNLGLQHETAAKGTLATCTQIVFTYAFELAFLHEPINGWSVSGTILIIGFMLMVAIHKMRVAEETIVHEMVAGDEPEEVELVL